MGIGPQEREALEKIGGAMRTAREAAERTQRAVAEEIKTKQPQISRWEKGKSNFGVVQLLKYAEACRVRPERLVEGIIAPTVEQMRLELDPVAGGLVTGLVELLHERSPIRETHSEAEGVGSTSAAVRL